MDSTPTPLGSVDHARWFVDALSGDDTVADLVPPGYAAYARILHPAAADDGRPVRWAEVAADQATTLHAAAEFARVARRRNSGGSHGWRGQDPYEGSLDRATLEALADVLAGHTTTPEIVWLNLWDGFAGLPAAWSDRPLVVQDGGYREYHAFRCTLAEIVALSQRFDRVGWGSLDGSESVGVAVAEYVGEGDAEETMPPRHPGEPDHSLQSPQQWWPDDRAWAVATEIDLDSTFVAGSAPLIEALMAHPGLETVCVEARTGLRDTVNPKPRG